MDEVMKFAELACAVLASFSLALVLEWLCLLGVMRLMPARAARTPRFSPNAGRPEAAARLIVIPSGARNHSAA
jgi:hypothetical protein